MTDDDLGLALELLDLGDLGRPLAIAVAASLGLWHFPPGSDAEEIARGHGMTASPLARLLDYFTAFRLLQRTSAGEYVPTAVGALLDDHEEVSLRNAYSLFPADIRSWDRLKHSLQTGRSAWLDTNGVDLWERLATHPDEETLFTAAMAEMTAVELSWLLEAFDWGGLETIVDIGGGAGAFAEALSKAFPGTSLIVQDLPRLLSDDTAGARSLPITFRPGDMFESVPPEADGYVMKRILYSYDDERAWQLLTNVRLAMRPDSTLIVIEPVRHRNSMSTYAALLDVQMLVLGGGKVRDRQELKELLGRASLRLTRIIPTPMSALIVARCA